MLMVGVCVECRYMELRSIEVAIKANEAVLASLQNKIEKTSDQITNLTIEISTLSNTMKDHKAYDSEKSKVLTELYSALDTKQESLNDLVREYNLQLIEHMGRTKLNEIAVADLKSIVAECRQTIEKNTKTWENIRLWFVGVVIVGVTGCITVAVVDPDAFPRITRFIGMFINLL